ncbi:lipase [Saccharopolyspora taberi]|uniref:Lipase n=1 Tax=Saccharopolyspora taberi TaxID=60895 RepID=A0ABN3VAZ2_9PSEU
MARFTRGIAAVAAVVFALLPGLAAPAAAQPEFAPVDQPGPALSVPEDRLRQSLRCTSDVRGAGRDVVLLIHGTTLDPGTNFDGNWFAALDQLGWPYCSVALPDSAMNDVQVSAEYVVHAVREISGASGHKVDIVGFSQGGLVPRFALRFWPDIRAGVDDYVALAATNHGSLTVDGMCVPGCAPALQQQRYHSELTRATNSYQETFAGISYTDIYSHTDQFVTPNLDDSGTTSLHGGGGSITNVAVQDVCPLHVADHLAVGTYDPVAYALAMDALTHPGPADPERVPSDTCGQLFMPGVDPLTFPGKYVDLWDTVLVELVAYPHVRSEPPLKPYVYARR